MRVVDFELAEGLRPEALLALLDALTRVDVAQLERHPNTPPLYRSGVRYEREGGEVFSDILTTLRRGWGDCEDLACWRVAELRRAGETRARPHVTLGQEAGHPLFHIRVRRGNGAIEDPSALLGMPT